MLDFEENLAIAPKEIMVFVDCQVSTYPQMSQQ